VKITNSLMRIENYETWFWNGSKEVDKRFSIPACTITGSSSSLSRRAEKSVTSPMLTNGTKVLQLESAATISMPGKATYTTPPAPCSVTKLRGAKAAAAVHSLHDSDNSGVEARNVASISLVSNLTHHLKLLTRKV